MNESPKRILVWIVVAQFAATSLWFAGNAILGELQKELQITSDITSSLTIAVQLGFIIGTLSYAIFMIPDRFCPAKVFFVSAVSAALINLLIIFYLNYWSLLGARFLTGFFLAGIYPVGLKIASDWFKKSLGNALGFLVGALVLGTAFPHLIRTFSMDLPWQAVVITTSALAIGGGLIVNYLVGDGPYRTISSGFSFKVFFSLFSKKKFNRAALGYFGHMWELYAFWAFVPYLIHQYSDSNMAGLNTSYWSFIVIAVGALGCIIGGLYSKRLGSCRVAFFALLISGLCALLVPFTTYLSPAIFLIFIMIWGFFVIMDSPQFSSVIADYAPSEYLGSALTIVNCLGFALTIVSIELLSYLEFLGDYRFLFLAIGPIIGLIPTGKIAFRPNFPAL